MAVAISGIEVELREVILRDKPPQLLEASPKGTVPVLELADGQVIDESLEIMRWTLARNDPDDWQSGTDAVLVATNDGPFKAALDRYKYPHRYDLPDVSSCRQEGLAFLAALNDRLRLTSHLTRDSVAFADVAVFPFVRQFAATNQDWFDALPLPELQRWLQGLTTSPLFDAIMQRVPAWCHGDPEIIFP